MFTLLDMIVSSGATTGEMMYKTKLTRKKYYSRLQILKEQGLVKRERQRYGEYVSTSLGLAIWRIHDLCARIVSNHWRLKTYDGSEGLHPTERAQLLNSLIKDETVKKLIVE
jgi:DNA-binding transcriptional ArsR family regulator